MTTTVVGLFDGFAEAQRLIHPLVAQGVRREDITLIVNPEAIAVGDVLVAGAWGVNVDVGPASRGEPAALLALGMPAEVVVPYAEGLRRGGTLVSVAAAEDQVDAAVELMERSAPAALAAQG
jgi:hypothetical protein